MPSGAPRKAPAKAKPPRKRAPVRHEKAAPPWSFVLELGLSKKQLAESVGLRPEALYKTRRAGATKTQTAFGDRTAEALVKSGQAAALRDYLDSIALGGFA